MSADMERLESQLAKARAALERATTVATSTHAKSEAATPGGLNNYDPALLSGIRRKPNRKADSRRFNAYSREAEAQINLDRLRGEVRRLELRLVDAMKERDRPRLTRDDIVGARAVRTQFGWVKVRKVNAKSVSVETGYTWADLVPFEKVLEVHR